MHHISYAEGKRKNDSTFVLICAACGETKQLVQEEGSRDHP